MAELAAEDPKLDGALLSKEHTLYLLAYMATSGGHFSRPSGMGGYWSYSG